MTSRWDAGSGKECPGKGGLEIANRLCCPKEGKPFESGSCHWVGSGDCAHNRCDDATEFTVTTDGWGDDIVSRCGSGLQLLCSPLSQGTS